LGKNKLSPFYTKIIKVLIKMEFTNPKYTKQYIPCSYSKYLRIDPW